MIDNEQFLINFDASFLMQGLAWWDNKSVVPFYNSDSQHYTYN